MITVKFKDGTHAVPTRWEELDENFSSAFVAMCPWLEKFETNQCTFDEMKTGLAIAALGVSASRIRKVNDILSENLYRVAEVITFPYSEGELDENGNIPVSVQVVLPRNLQPTVSYRGYFKKREIKCLHDFSITPGGIVHCDIPADLYADTLDLLEIYTSTRDEEALDDLFEKYYGRIPYHAHDIKLALYYNLRGYFDWVRTLPDYNLLFQQKSGTTERRPAAPLGSSSGIYTLSKSGYGTLDEIKKLPLFEYLGAMVQIVVDNIRELDAMKVKPSEIASKLGLDVEQVLPYLNNEKE